MALNPGLTRWLMACLLLLAQVAHAEEKPAVEPYDAWFVMKMGGNKAGHMHVTLGQEGDKIVSTTQMKLAIKRGNAELVIEQSSRFEETLDFKPIVTVQKMKMSAISQEQKLEFKDGKWLLTSGVGGLNSTKEIDAAEPGWLTPGGMHKHMEAAIARGEKQVVVRTLDLSTGVNPIKIKMMRGETEDIEVFGRVVPATKWTMTMDALPGISLEQWSDDKGQPVRQLMPLMPGMEIEMLLADKALATAPFDAPEMLSGSLIQPDKAIKRPRNLTKATFVLESEGLDKVFENQATMSSVQDAKVNGKTATVTIDLTAEPRLNKMGVDPGLYEATPMLNFEDEAVKGLIKKALDGVQEGKDKAAVIRKAQAIRAFVREHIDAKDLSVGFASASEVARTGQGDCTEHACLLAAMLRGAGIPARTATGLVYADQFQGHEGVFGFHMWAQAWVATTSNQGYWLDLDAALPGETGSFDATHIVLSTSLMQEDEGLNELVTMLPLMQGLKIEVRQTQWMK